MVVRMKDIQVFTVFVLKVGHDDYVERHTVC